MKLVAMACVLATLGVLGMGHASAGETSFVGVRNGASERSFFLSRTVVNPGPSIIEYNNTGEDPHDLKVKRRGDARIFAIGELEPGGVGSVSPRLKRDSRYELWCSLDGHRESGMEAVLRVRDVRPPR